MNWYICSSLVVAQIEIHKSDLAINKQTKKQVQRQFGEERERERERENHITMSYKLCCAICKTKELLQT
jgi:hypothetical protein